MIWAAEAGFLEGGGTGGHKPGYAQGQLVEEGRYTNSKLVGTWKRYWPNGKVMSEITYQMGRPRGAYKTYYPSGKVEEQGSWDLDRNTGKFQRWHPNGQLAQDFTFTADGVCDGQQKYYHENGDSFDAITFWAVFEHLAEPRTFLAKAASLLKPGGHCFVLVPNLDSLAIRILGPRYRYVMAEHLNYFSRQTLIRLAHEVPDLDVVELRSTHFNPVVLWQDWRSPRDRVPDAERAALLRRTTRWKESAAPAPVRQVYSGVELLLGSLNLADNLDARAAAALTPGGQAPVAPERSRD